ncbi:MULTISPECIES: GNAT family N-acetyltransferase [unclassified Mesorhizobium]|uniref:GNAT family N-acetyltransferase n=1 Tax=unclassified Mesorhizobium TaxID=325217 RepID=UPI000FD8A380|nr:MULTISPECIES: GNAT family N-acetyltransferase [unclassified Mesorhizobium]TGQ31026.1 N-acetyltransferase [Mesorhizobium sp. M00.F.Ca.ET.216.01.1.1]TIS55662.1 MAG: GNAT family N-acetyltransferase [Mesorhizobium sp.]TIS86731.1 MAG: GNAT family N-acetyltransferase [Mesorhizobium sp.]TJW06361.1 MAG: GNAT family N-acetyltransferase [Mesorhizobium sp.]TJW45893.1 MAG: GNAT family N-acetyltransferase [Mesorhizobium sp.]
MHTTEITLVDFAPEHLDGAVALSSQAGWPHRREDWAMMLALSTGTVALEGDRVVGTTLVTRYGKAAATINMVIVDAVMRGRGIGRKLMDLALQATEGRECRLVATGEGLPLYEKLGFRATGEISQHQGMPVETGSSADVAWATSDDIGRLVELDRSACGMDRSGLIGLLSEQARIAVLRRPEGPAGFAALRVFGRGKVAGPVVAETADDARNLLSFLFAAGHGGLVRVDTPNGSGLSPWLAELGLAKVGGGIAMRRDGAASPATSRAQTYALASQALG